MSDEHDDILGEDHDEFGIPTGKRKASAIPGRSSDADDFGSDDDLGLDDVDPFFDEFAMGDSDDLGY